MTHRKGSNRGKTGTKEIIQMILFRQCFLCSPTIHTITNAIAILHFGKTESLINSQTGRKRDFMCARTPLFGRYQNHAIGRLTSIQSCCRCTFQYSNALHIFRIQVGNAIPPVTIARISSPANSRIGLFGSRIQHRHSVYHIQWLIITDHRTDATNTDLSRSPRTGRVFTYLHTRRLSGQSSNHIRLFYPVQLITLQLHGRIRQR